MYITNIHRAVSTMQRTQIYLTTEEQQGLRQLAERSGRTQSDLIREAIDHYLLERSPDDRRALLARAGGLWAGRSDLPDFRRLRDEWDRT